MASLRLLIIFLISMVPLLGLQDSLGLREGLVTLKEDSLVPYMVRSVYSPQGVMTSSSVGVEGNLCINKALLSDCQLSMHRRQVDSSTSEWSQVDYQLQTVTGKSSLQIISLFRYSEDLEADRLPTEAVIQATDFSRDYVEQVIGKIAPLEDIVLHCGHLNIHPQVTPNKVFTFLLGNVELGCIGRVREDGRPKEDLGRLDSILIEEEGDKQAFQYNFFVRSHTQYSIRYEVNFTLTSDKEFNPAEYHCASCQNRQAALVCKTEELSFCDECCRDHHRPKVMQGHIIEPLDKINSLPFCKSHNKRFQNYCLKRQRYLCPGCMEKGGSHSNNDHPVYPIPQLYEQLRQTNESSSIKQREKIENLIRNAQLKREELTQNYTETLQFIEQQYQKATQTLNSLYQDKLSRITSDQIHLKMVHEKLEWSKAFIKFQEKSLLPIYYFQAHKHYARDTSKVKVSDFESIFALKADLAAEGEIVVAKRQNLDRSRNRVVPQTSRTQPAPQPLNGSSASRRQPQEPLAASGVSKVTNRPATIYDYNASAEAPQRGHLFGNLEKSQLNFFCLST